MKTCYSVDIKVDIFMVHVHICTNDTNFCKLVALQVSVLMVMSCMQVHGGSHTENLALQNVQVKLLYS